jgi:hypothetical protein
MGTEKLSPRSKKTSVWIDAEIGGKSRFLRKKLNRNCLIISIKGGEVFSLLPSAEPDLIGRQLRAYDGPLWFGALPCSGCSPTIRQRKFIFFKRWKEKDL